jgi:protein-disulfide isomerase
MFAGAAGQQIIDEYANTGLVRFAVRNFPFLGQESDWAAQAAECAADQGAFWPYHDKLFAEWIGEGSGAYTIPNLVRYANDLGLDGDALGACVQAGTYADRVAAEGALGQQLGVRSTPWVFINGRAVTGNQDFIVYQDIIEEELAGGD